MAENKGTEGESHGVPLAAAAAAATSGTKTWSAAAVPLSLMNNHSAMPSAAGMTGFRGFRL